jgi:imidazolonepropionase
VEPDAIRDAVVAWDGETLVFVGPRRDWDGSVDEERPGCTIIPGFVDCHTHLPFFGWRDDEFEARVRGESYRDQHGEGGIPRSARMLAEATDEEVLAFCRPLLAEMLAHGSTALELKTGYGLSVEGELRQARLARRLAEEASQTATVTLLACHTVPPGWMREDWVSTACEELIPAAAREGLVDAVDVWVEEEIAFTVEDLSAVADVAAQVGLPVRCHADQLMASGGAEAAASLGARSADHLNHAGPEAPAALAAASTVAVLLPASTLMLRAEPPRVDAFLDSGVPLAVASDSNPGTSPVLSMPLAIALACSWYGLSSGTALVASTANPAWVLGLHERLGTLEPGKRADFLILEGDDFRLVPYRLGHNPVLDVFVGGERISGR